MIIDKEKIIFIHIPKTAGTSIRSYFKSISRRKKKPRKHATIKEIEYSFPTEYKTYKKFTVVRNPYDRILSWFFYLKTKKNSHVQNMEFKEWLNYLVEIKKNKIFSTKHITSIIMLSQSFWINNTVEIIKFENLNEELNKLFNKQINLPIINKSNHKYYLEYYNKESLNIIYDIYKEDFKKFNYKKL
tara:strand:+ start:13 stop:573 length:561 start_codon:yes stop_codon:yes gene_type:complete